MRLPEIAQRLYKSAQLFFQFDDVDLGSKTRSPSALVGSSRCDDRGRRSAPTLPVRQRNHPLERQARELLRSLGADKLAREIRVEWNPRLKTCAGRADYREKLISLNPLLQNHGEEIDRTLRHELAHLLAQWRVGRRRIAPHGAEWRAACRELGIADEARCHNLPFATKVYPPRYVYHCPNCKQEFPRVRKIRRAIACLACCRKHNGGDFDPRFRLKPIATNDS
ncbi:MAG TPA: SprT-like domain-containing protein [Chthoniobacterales bacterium]|jgi:predicted SprT family Zn-dependent metalloprotease|nr:SprT-like domain-containing protein [Chthoniobacterales bacterium]